MVHVTVDETPFCSAGRAAGDTGIDFVEGKLELPLELATGIFMVLREVEVDSFSESDPMMMVPKWTVALVFVLNFPEVEADSFFESEPMVIAPK